MCCPCIEPVCLPMSAEESRENFSSNSKQMSKTADTVVNSKAVDESKEEIKSEKTSVSTETWISIEDFCVCFQ